MYREFEPIPAESCDVDGLAQIRVVPLAEKGSSKVTLLVRACTDRMGK